MRFKACKIFQHHIFPSIMLELQLNEFIQIKECFVVIYRENVEKIRQKKKSEILDSRI